LKDAPYKYQKSMWKKVEQYLNECWPKNCWLEIVDQKLLLTSKTLLTTKFEHFYHIDNIDHTLIVPPRMGTSNFVRK
jgi:hypothetical protein